jgi:hypothetical protein
MDKINLQIKWACCMDFLHIAEAKACLLSRALWVMWREIFWQAWTHIDNLLTPRVKLIECCRVLCQYFWLAVAKLLKPVVVDLAVLNVK